MPKGWAWDELELSKQRRRKDSPGHIIPGMAHPKTQEWGRVFEEMKEEKQSWRMEIDPYHKEEVLKSSWWAWLLFAKETLNIMFYSKHVCPNIRIGDVRSKDPSIWGTACPHWALCQHLSEWVELSPGVLCRRLRVTPVSLHTRGTWFNLYIPKCFV